MEEGPRFDPSALRRGRWLAGDLGQSEYAGDHITDERLDQKLSFLCVINHLSNLKTTTQTFDHSFIRIIFKKSNTIVWAATWSQTESWRLALGGCEKLVWKGVYSQTDAEDRYDMLYLEALRRRRTRIKPPYRPLEVQEEQISSEPHSAWLQQVFGGLYAKHKQDPRRDSDREPKRPAFSTRPRSGKHAHVLKADLTGERTGAAVGRDEKRVNRSDLQFGLIQRGR